MSADWLPAISANPYLSFYMKATASGTLELAWTDDKDKTVKKTAIIKVSWAEWRLQAKRFPKVIMITAALFIMATFTMQATAGRSIQSNKYTVDDRRSGNTFATKETNAT